jgi:hypothetical protein
LKTFVELEDMLATEVLRARADIRIEHRSADDRCMNPGHIKDTTWQDFTARADLDGLIYERLVARAMGSLLYPQASWNPFRNGAFR